jgi:hypothetical protein
MKNKATRKQKEIEHLLEQALLQEGELSHALYEFELREHLDFWTAGMNRDGEDFVLVVTVNRGDVAMVIIRKTGELLINAEARTYLRLIWMQNYVSNIRQMVPQFAEDLINGRLAVTGVKFADFGR